MNKIIKYDEKNLLNVESLLNKFKFFSNKKMFSIAYFYKIQNNLIYYYQEQTIFYDTGKIKYYFFQTVNLDKIIRFWDLKNSLFF